MSSPQSTSERHRLASGWVFPAILLIGGLVFACTQAMRSQGVAPTPGPFAEGRTFPEAIALAGERNAPVVVLATADWCPPCQALKRGALADPEVHQRLADLGVVTVYADLTDDSDPASVDAGQRLAIESLPTMVYLDPSGQEVSRRVGAGSSSAVIAWLNAASSSAR